MGSFTCSYTDESAEQNAWALQHKSYSWGRQCIAQQWFLMCEEVDRALLQNSDSWSAVRAD